MPSTNVTASLQGVVGNFNFNASSWSQIRNASQGNITNTYTSSSNVACAIQVDFSSSRFGRSGLLNRTFLFFDFSSISGTITNVQLSIPGVTNSSSGVIVVSASAWGGSGGTTALTNSDFSNVSFGTNYSSCKNIWSTSTMSPNIFSLNSTGISAANTNRYLNVALINCLYDNSGTTPSNGTSECSGIRFKNTSTPCFATVTDVAAGYGNEVIGVSSSDIGFVNDVATASIANVIDVT